MIGVILQHIATAGVWLVAHLPGWAWVVIAIFVGLSLLRRGPLLGLVGLGLAMRGGSRGVHALHAQPLKMLVVVVIACAALGHALGMGDGGPAPAPAVAAASLTSAPGPGTVYTYAQLSGALSDLGEMPGNARIGAAVAEAESGGRANALCNSCGGVREYSVGPWQINLYAHPDVSESCAQDLSCAARAADRISSHGMDWGAWSTYTSGAYRAHLS